MGYTTSTVHGIEVPDSAEANNIPEDIGKVVTALETGSLVKRLTSAQIAALTGPQKPNGLVVFNTTTGRLQISNGTSFSDVAPLLTPPSFEGVRTSTSTRTSSPWTINYTAETDPLGMLDTSTGGATLTAGLWLVAGHAAVTMAADSSAVQLIVMKDGVEGAANKTQLVNAGDYGSLAVSEVVRVTSTMSVWLSAVARSGITWYVNQAKFSVVKLGEL